MRYRRLLPALIMTGLISPPVAHAQYYPYPGYYAPGYAAPGYYPPGYYRPPPQYYYSAPPTYAAPPAYAMPPNYSSANCGTPDQFKPCTR